MASKNVIELTTASFNKTVTGDKPVLVDFWAPWCGPCRALTPIVDRIADQYAGKAIVGKVNVDENQELALKYDITTIPRVLVFKGNEKPLHQLVGLVPETELTKLLDKAIAG
ncbi:MAG: thioredoxin [Gemmataceae bacterium]